MMGSETANETIEPNVATQWFEDEANQKINVPEFEQLCSELHKQNLYVKDFAKQLEAAEAVLKKMKNKIMAYLDEFGKEKYNSNEGLIFIVNKFSVQVPKDPIAKQQFLDWLKERGIFDQTITVHSATLNSLYNNCLEESGNPDFEIPGIGKGTHYKTLTIRGK